MRLYILPALITLDFNSHYTVVVVVELEEDVDVEVVDVEVVEVVVVDVVGRVSSLNSTTSTPS